MNQRSDDERHHAMRPPGPAETAGAEQAVVADVEALHQALSDGENRYLRLAADFENFRRRKDQELLDSRRYSSEEAARAMLPVLDNLRRAVEHAPEGGAEDDLVNGLTLVIREFDAALARIGVTPVPGEGAPFDPAVHEAIGGEEADVDHDTVSAVLLPGYRLHDRLLRPALVRVAHPRHAEAAP
ncbi:MAG: nucleotide exchange factor GrpE [Candidatus Dormibacteraeota bacterium]|nr:nucleotide exchange factor GrpE [Candidatus Dormibacteraeota bacterium]